MNKTVLLGFLLLTAIGVLACQKYTDTLVESPRRADEGATISTLRSIAQAQTAYSVSNSGDYGTFEQLVAAGHLDARFNSNQPKRNGYSFTMTIENRSSGAGQSSYHCNVDPDPVANRTGRHFYLGSDSPEIRVNPTQRASANDEPFRP